MSRRARPAARGVSLIEAMIALVVLSVGLMGMIGLKLSVLKMTGHANSRTVASMHAGDILDRIRANPIRAAAGEYQLALTAPTPPAPVGVAQVDLAQWRSGLANNLPGGNGSVAVQPDGSALIVVQWTERAERVDAPRVLSFTFEARL